MALHCFVTTGSDPTVTSNGGRINKQRQALAIIFELEKLGAIMAKTTEADKISYKHGQWQYCRLATSLVDGMAIANGLVASSNVSPILDFFILAGHEQVVSKWVMPEGKPMVETHFLQMVGWLIGQQVFMVGKKSRLADYLYMRGEMESSTQNQSIRTMMSREIPRKIDKALEQIYRKCFNVE